MKRSLALAALLGISLTGFGGAALAAQTRTLPAGETLWAVDCEDIRGELVSFDVATAVGTSIGDSAGDDFIDCAGPGSWDPATGLGYWVSWTNAMPYHLFSIDLETGASTDVGELIEDGVTYNNYYGLIIDPEAGAFVINPIPGNLVHLSRVNLSTGVATAVGDLTLDGASYADHNSIWSAAYNPADGKSYFIDVYGGDNKLYSIDLETAEVTLIGNSVEPEWYGLAFDSNGVMWTTGQSLVCSSTVEGWGVEGVEECSDNGTTVDGSGWFSESNFISYTYDAHSDLAATGFDPSGIIFGAIGLIVTGVAVTVRRRVQN